jgi:hypothetical protein
MRSVRNWDLVWALPSAALEPYAHVLWVVRSKDSLDSKHDGRTFPWRYDIVCMCILQRLNTQAHSWLAETWTINSPFLSREIIRRTHWAGFFAFCFLLGAVHPSCDSTCLERSTRCLTSSWLIISCLSLTIGCHNLPVNLKVSEHAGFYHAQEENYYNESRILVSHWYTGFVSAKGQSYELGTL